MANPAKIYCANCGHCVVKRVPTGNPGQFVYRVKCAQNMWKKKLGEDKVFKYFTVIRRTMDECSKYDPMGDSKTFLKQLKKTLPVKDEIYREKA